MSVEDQVTSEQPEIGLISLFGLDPATYQVHSLHGDDQTYAETNCYADVIIEMLHARGDEPLAALGHTVAVDFEGDQWTFFKPPSADVQALFGVGIHEMQPYRPLPEQIAEQLAAGRTMTVELDSWFLPDTAATAYRRQHVKSTVIAESIDVANQRLRYFHNAGYYELDGDDFLGVFRLTDAFSADVLPPFTELVRFDAQRRLNGAALRDQAIGILAGHYANRPRSNPFLRFGDRLTTDLPALLERPIQAYHDYAFATVRMADGRAAFELAAAHLSWLYGADANPVTTPLLSIVDGTKALSFRLARRRAFDPAPIADELGMQWDDAMSHLATLL